jgi:hypothetical protein
LVALALGACSWSHYQFTQDNRRHFTSPKARSTVVLPVTVRWRMTNYDGVFGVFVDRAPIAAGQSLRQIAHGDRVCLATAGCPDAGYLAAHNVFTTTDPQAVISTFGKAPNGRDGLHVVTVVLLSGDAAHKRIGESAWILEVKR